jgi:hypothetical protein
MPYIKPWDREHLYPHDRRHFQKDASNAGELNFQISMLVNTYLQNKGLSYSNINEAIGVLECAKLECYARVARPYEDEKILLNGDVYHPSLVTPESITT